MGVLEAEENTVRLISISHNILRYSSNSIMSNNKWLRLN